ncbi:Wadjet anti-phage system protein JetD domain-containing protein [Bremerella sp.]|uniref:Wadjet anti-phage system protein JetD domain-containing protein n=1 Tax=Bremerella sp. TaxID=2795602 RepID=UPI00391D5BD8
MHILSTIVGITFHSGSGQSAINVNEAKFEWRFGLRDGSAHRAVRILDTQLQEQLNLPFDELSLPRASIARLPLQEVTVFIVENDLNLLTLPLLTRAIAIRGEGNAVSRLEVVDLLNNNRLIYWGDIDVEGFLILSRLRNLFPHVESAVMDLNTLNSHRDFSFTGNAATRMMPTYLTLNESEAFLRCIKEDCRLEQEKIFQTFAEGQIQQVISFPRP